MTPPNRFIQVVLCDGPRCSRHPDFPGLVAAAQQAVQDAPSERTLSSYDCFGRCGAGPNVLLRMVEGEDLARKSPGYRELDDGEYYAEMSRVRLTQLLPPPGS